MSDTKFKIVETDERTERCMECYFFQPSPSGSHGYCKESPPVFTNVDPEGRPRFYNPVVSPHGWCGRFEPFEDD